MLDPGASFQAGFVPMQKRSPHECGLPARLPAPPGPSRMLRSDLAEESVILHFPATRNTRREVKHAQAAAVTAVSEDQPPESGNYQWPAAWLEHLPEKRSRADVEGIDTAIAEVSGQQSATKLTEVRRSYGHAPRRIQCSLRSEPPYQHAAGIEHIDEPIPWSSHVIVHVGVLLGIGNVQLSPDILNVEWSETRGDAGVLECGRRNDRCEIRVEHINRACVKIGREKEIAVYIRAHRQAFVDCFGSRVVYLGDRVCRVHHWVPS